MGTKTARLECERLSCKLSVAACLKNQEQAHRQPTYSSVAFHCLDCEQGRGIARQHGVVLEEAPERPAVAARSPPKEEPGSGGRKPRRDVTLRSAKATARIPGKKQ
jgi:hypothetical protein